MLYKNIAFGEAAETRKSSPGAPKLGNQWFTLDFLYKKIAFGEAVETRKSSPGAPRLGNQWFPLDFLYKNIILGGKTLTNLNKSNTFGTKTNTNLKETNVFTRKHWKTIAKPMFSIRNIRKPKQNQWLFLAET